MKEIKVATLTKEEVKELKELYKMDGKIRVLIAQTSSAHSAFWEKVRVEHSLLRGHHYITGKTIYRQDV